MLNRLTANFSNLIQEPVHWLPQVRPSLFAMLERAIASLVELPFRSGLSIPYSAPLLDSFFQFDRVLDYQKSFIPLPVIGPTLGLTGETTGEDWGGFWIGMITGLSDLFWSVLNPLNKALIQLSEFQFDRGTGVSTQQITRLDGVSGISFSVPSVSEFRIQSERQFTESLTQRQQSFSQFSSGLVDRLVQSISQSNRTEIFHLATFLSGSLSTSTEHSTSIQLGTVRDLQPKLAWGDIFVNSTAAPPITLQLPDASLPEFGSSEPSITNFVLTEVAQSSATNLPPPSQSELKPELTSAPVTFNGGIHVQITAQTIDREHADETARLIAGQVLREITRLTEQDRFLRGLPPSPWR